MIHHAVEVNFALWMMELSGQGAREQAEVLEELPAVERFSGEKSGMASRTSLGSESSTGKYVISTQLHDMFQYVSVERRLDDAIESGFWVVTGF